VNTRLHCEQQPRKQVAGTDDAGTATSGVPLVCIHGWGMNLRAFDPLRAALEADCSSWALDLPGHGRSDWHEARAGFTSQADDLLAALPQECVLLGWSLGGQFAMELARRAPQRVRALVLVTTTPRFPQAPGWTHGLDAATIDTFRELLEQDWRDTLRDFVHLQVRGSRNAEAIQQQLNHALQFHGMPREAALRAGLALLASVDQRADASLIHQPVLVLSGQHDRVTPPDAGQWLADNLPEARHEVIARAGHAPMLSHVDETAVALRGFLRELQAVAA
jgi:pimeloyl-[acyl-carrier protein] methyl ester esterase